MSYIVEVPKMYFPKPFWDIAIVMIPPYPNDPLTVRELPNKVHDPLVRWVQFRIRIVNDVPIQNKFIIFRNIAEKAPKFLI